MIAISCGKPSILINKILQHEKEYDCRNVKCNWANPIIKYSEDNDT